MKVSYTPPVVDYKARRKSVAIPDQSLSIQEIVKRYVRGIPVDVVQRQGVFVDQAEHDLEKLSRMDFGEKAAFADTMKSEAERLQSELRQAEEVKRTQAQQAKEAAEKAADDRAEQRASAKQKGASTPPA